MNQSNHPDIDLTPWRELFQLGAIAILTAVLFFRRFYGVELMQFDGFGIYKGMPAEWPVSAAKWFDLLQSNTFIALNLLGIRDLVNYLLLAVFLLALYAVLKHTRPVAAGLAVVFGWVGTTVYIVSNQALSMLHLSQRYAEASSPAEQSLYLAAGEALLAVENPGRLLQGTGVHLGLFLVLLAGLMLSIVMFNSHYFTKATAIAGTLANGLGLLLFPFLLAAPSLAWIPPSSSALFRILWYVLSAITLLKLARPNSTSEDKP
jgi:hypothetical protein